MCYIHNQDSNKCKDRELSTQEWKRIFDEAYEMGLMFAGLTGGECLVREDFKELYLHLWKKRVMISVLTNGTLVDDDYVDFFKTYPPEQIQITLYGSSEENYLTVTGHRRFAKAVTAIQKLKEANVNFHVNVTPCKQNIKDYINTIQFIRNSGYEPSLTDLFLTPKLDDPEGTDHYLSADEIFTLSKERALLDGALTPVENPPSTGGDCSVPPQKGLVCNAGRGSACVTWEGIMYPCVDVRVGEGASLREMSYAEAWEKTKAAADTVVYGVECVGCPYDKICPQCPGIRLQGLHSGHCRPEICEMAQRFVAAGIRKLD